MTEKKRKAPTPGAGRKRLVKSLHYHEAMVDLRQKEIAELDAREEAKRTRVPAAVKRGYRALLEHQAKTDPEGLRQEAMQFPDMPLSTFEATDAQLIEAMVEAKFAVHQPVREELPMTTAD